jgi:hypothetical protein
VTAAPLDELRAWLDARSLPMPVVPDDLRAQLREVRPELWSTSAEIDEPYDAPFLLRDVLLDPSLRYALIGTGGRGASTRTFNFTVADTHLALFVQCLYGGVGRDEKETALVGRSLERASAIVDAVERAPLGAGERLFVLHNELGGSLWRRFAPGEEPALDDSWHESADALDEALADLTG